MGVLHIHTSQQRGRCAKPMMQLETSCQAEAANFRDVHMAAIVEARIPRRSRRIRKTYGMESLTVYLALWDLSNFSLRFLSPSFDTNVSAVPALTVTGNKSILSTQFEWLPVPVAAAGFTTLLPTLLLCTYHTS